LSDYWSRPHWSASLIWRNQVLAGFCLINDKTHSGQGRQPKRRGVLYIKKTSRAGCGAKSLLQHIFVFASGDPGKFAVAAKERAGAGILA